MVAPLPANESKRLEALAGFNILDTDPEEAFDDITRFVCDLFDVPICAVSLVDEGRQWFKSIVGLEVKETPRDVAFCAHAIHNPDEVLVVENALIDKRFSDNALVTGNPNILFYAGAPLTTHDGYPLGTLCVIDRKPRQLTAIQLGILRKFAEQIMTQLELSKALRNQTELTDKYARSEERLFRAQSVSGVGSWEMNLSDKTFHWTLKTFEIFALDPSHGAPDVDTLLERHHPDDADILRQAINDGIQFGRSYQLDLRVKRGGGYLHVQENGEVIFDEDGNPAKIVGTIVDISSRKFSEVRLHQHSLEVERLLRDVKSTAKRAQEMAEMYQFSAKRFETLFAGLPVACMGIDLAGNIMEWNRVSEELFGYTAGETLFHNAVDLLHPPGTRALAREQFEQAIRDGGRSETRERVLVTKDGRQVWVLATSLPFLDAHGELVGIIKTNVDITARKLAEAELMTTKQQIQEQHEALQVAHRALEQQATTDGLTGLKNHRAFQEFLSTAFAVAFMEGEQLGLLLLDVDHFKEFNDTFGHPAGDIVLKQVADLFSEAAGPDALTARYGGEEFAAVFPGVGPRALARYAEKIRSAIASADWPDRLVTVSIGASSFGKDISSKTELIKIADQALYASKSHGRNRVTIGRPVRKAA